MKKVLLFACVVFAAVSVSAQQQLVSVKNAVGSVELKKEMCPVKNENIKLAPELLTSVKDFSNLKKSLKAPAQGNLYGDYIEDAIMDTDAEFHGACPAILQEYEEEGVKYVNIILDFGYADILGTYDAETGTITCNAQYCYEHETYGKFAIFGYDAATEKLTDNLSFSIDRDNNISLDQDAYYIQLVDDKAGEYKGYGWDGLHTAATLYAENAEYSCNLGTSPVTDKLAIEDFEYSLSVHNFLNTTVSLDINEDMTVSMATAQNIMETSSNADKDIYGDYMFVCGLVTQDGKDYIDYEAPEVVGTLSGNTITLDPFFIASQYDEDGRAYAANVSNVVITLTKGNFVAGIQEVTDTREEKIKSTKTYNVMGQQVNRDTAKGLLIRDGKKYFKK